MEKKHCKDFSLRLILLLTGLFLGLVMYSPGYCLDPPVITPIDEFFIEHNGGEVQTTPPGWKLVVDGLVEQPLELSIDDILEYPSQTHMATIECGGNPFAFKVADLIGNATWTGVPVRTILEHAGLLDNATSVIFTALDGYTVPVDIETIYARDDIMLAYSMNGETLPPEQGYPLRLTVPGVLGAVWAQWVTHVEISSEEGPGPRAPLPPHCQIFTPAHEQTIDLNTHRIYGMALAGDNEIVEVEVSTDGGFSWQPAAILTEYVPNVWRHWEFYWTPPVPGNYTISARAINTAGEIQQKTGFYGWNIFSIGVNAEGPDACVYGEPCESGLYCDEAADKCVECLDDGHCEDFYACADNICIVECPLTITHKKILSKKLSKSKKRTLMITGGEDFDPYGEIDLFPLEVVRTKLKRRKNVLKVRALVPAGLEPQIIPIRVGDCVGEIEIL